MPVGLQEVHSTETLLLALFDVSAAFDTVDHNILLKRLNVTFAVSGSFLRQIGSFLHERTYCVVHGSTRSRWVPAPYGLPQGSVLGPLLYIIYTSGLTLLLAEHGALGQLYADETQAYMHCMSSKAATTVRAMGQTLTALETWMASNRLCLNHAKTKFMGTPQQLAKLNLIDLSAEFSN